MSKIKEARKAAGFTQQQIKDLIGIPTRTLQGWENGERKCPEWTEKLVVAEIERLSKK